MSYRSFRSFLLEAEEAWQGQWTDPNPNEHEEVLYQLEGDAEHSFLPEWVRTRLTMLREPTAWRAALNRGTVKVFTPAQFPDVGNTGDAWEDMHLNTNPDDAPKRERAPLLFRGTKSVERPIYLRNPKTNEYWLISGHHRSTYAREILRIPVEVHVIE